MDPASTHRFSTLQQAVALIIGSVALLMLGLQPVLLGEMEAKKFISLEGVGIVAMGEIFTLGLGVALSDALLPITRHMLVTTIAALLAAALNLATLTASSDGGFVAFRAASGLVEGVMLWAATCVIVRSANPEHLAAIFMVVSTAAQGVLAALLADFVVPAAGWKGGFQALAAFTGICAVLAAWLPPRLAPLQSAEVEKLRWSIASVLPLAIAFLQLAALSAVWAYLESIGKGVGLDELAARRMPSKVLVMQVLGGVAATWAVRRYAPVPTLAVGGAVLAAVIGGIHFLPYEADGSFTLLCAVFGFTWLFLLPFQIALAFRADRKGRVAVLIPAAQLVGSAIGPLVAGLTVSEEDAHSVPLVSFGFAIAATVLVTAGWRIWPSFNAVAKEVEPAPKRLDGMEQPIA